MNTFLTPAQSNVLIDSDGHARITDVGLEDYGDILWAAQEILDERGKHSKEVDILSFAMVMVEVSRGRYTLCEVFIPRHLGQCRSSLHLAILRPTWL